MMEYGGVMWVPDRLAADLKLRKENQVFVFAGGIFCLWRLVAGGCPVAQLDLFGGVYAWIFRGVMAAALIVTDWFSSAC